MELGLEAITHDDSADDDYQAGIDRFTAAIEYFEEAEAIFRAGERRADSTFQIEMIDATCESTRLKAASEEYLLASRKADRENFQDAIDAMARGDRAIDRACG